MNNEMMLYQARQDFIDMHNDLLAGKSLTLEHYDTICNDLQSMDDDNFALILDHVEEVENVAIRPIYEQVISLIRATKKLGKWNERKREAFSWKDGRLIMLDR